MINRQASRQLFIIRCCCMVFQIEKRSRLVFENKKMENTDVKVFHGKFQFLHFQKK